MKAPLLRRIGSALNTLRGLETPRPRRQVRTVFAGARFDRNFQDWMASCLPADDEIRGDLRVLRMRGRQLSRDNSLAIAFLNHLSTNVLGEHGIALQAQFRQGEDLDEALNDEVEDAFRRWSENPFVDGTMSLEEGDDLMLRTTATDGEIFVRMYDGFPNEFGFALQLVDADQVDENDSSYHGVGELEVRMGIETTPYGRPAFYRIHPDPRSGSGFSFRPDRVPAEDVIHLGRRRRPNQSRFVSWFHGVMTDMHLLEGYLESEAVAARNHAAACLIWQDVEGAPPGDAAETPEKEGAPTPQVELAPGVTIDAPAGKQLATWNPTHPNEAAPAFVKMWERRISSGLDISYITLGNDAQDGNFSSQRIKIGADRDRWRRDQRWLIRVLKERVARRLFVNMLRRKLFPADLLPYPGQNLPFAWQPRTWEYVSPLEDIQARVLAMQHRVLSPQIVTAEQGRDAREIIKQWAKIQELADSLGVQLEPDQSPDPALTGQERNDYDDDGEPAANGSKAKPARAPAGSSNGNGNGAGSSKPRRSPRSRLPA